MSLCVKYIVTSFLIATKKGGPKTRLGAAPVAPDRASSGMSFSRQ